MPPEQQESSMRDDFEAAIEELTPAEDLDNSDEPDTAEPPQPEMAAGEDADAEADEPPAADDSADAEPSRVAAESEEVDDAAPDKSKDSIKAPVGWSPKARQYWSKLPREVQELVAGREQEITAVIANTKQARQTHEAFTQLANSYAPILAAEGVNPLEATQSLFQTVAQLRMGSPHQKAQIIAELIGNYDVDIGVLDNVLLDVPMADPEEERLNKMFEERFGPLMQAFEGMQYSQQHELAERDARARDEVAEFSQNAEFIHDVKLQMADLIDMAQARGQQMSLQEAYDIACRAHPEINEVLKEREEEARILAANGDIAAKRAAASSIVGRKTGVPAKNSEASLRESLADAWDNYGRA